MVDGIANPARIKLRVGNGTDSSEIGSLLGDAQLGDLSIFVERAEKVGKVLRRDFIAAKR